MMLGTQVDFSLITVITFQHLPPPLCFSIWAFCFIRIYTSCMFCYQNLSLLILIFLGNQNVSMYRVVSSIEAFLKLLFFIIYVFYFQLHWVFMGGHSLFQVAASGSSSLVAVHGLLITEASLIELQHRFSSSVAAALGLQSTRLNSCRAQAQLPCGVWNLPRPEIEPMSPAPAILTTTPPEKSNRRIF